MPTFVLIGFQRGDVIVLPSLDPMGSGLARAGFFLPPGGTHHPSCAERRTRSVLECEGHARAFNSAGGVHPNSKGSRHCGAVLAGCIVPHMVVHSPNRLWLWGVAVEGAKGFSPILGGGSGSIRIRSVRGSGAARVLRRIASTASAVEAFQLSPVGSTGGAIAIYRKPLRVSLNISSSMVPQSSSWSSEPK
jgi:hypothetical protein